MSGYQKVLMSNYKDAWHKKKTCQEIEKQNQPSSLERNKHNWNQMRLNPLRGRHRTTELFKEQSRLLNLNNKEKTGQPIVEAGEHHGRGSAQM